MSRFLFVLLVVAVAVFAGVRGAAVDSVVVFNEIQYHPAANDPRGEWVELHNQMAVDIDLSAWRLTAGVEFVFPEGVILPGGGYLIVAADPKRFEGLANGAAVYGPWTGALSNSGETLELRDRNRRLMDRFRFNDGAGWPVGPDGCGPALAKRDPQMPSEPRENWVSSGGAGGTPGQRNFSDRRILEGGAVFMGDSMRSGMDRRGWFRDALPWEGLVLNEVTGVDGVGWVEVICRSTTEIRTEGYRLRRFSGEKEWEIPLPKRSVAPGEIFALGLEELGVGFAVGDRLVLVREGGAVVADAVRVERGGRARSPDGWGDFLTPVRATKGSANDVQLRDEIVINEVFYHGPPTLDRPADGVRPATVYARNPEQWVELFNRSKQPVDLGRWRLDGDVAFEFPRGVTIAPGGFVVVARDPVALSARIPGLRPFGPFVGELSRENGDLILRDGVGNPADFVPYSDDGRWPERADGGGASLELRDPRSENGLGESWAASDERERSEWRTYEYEGVAAASAVGPDSQWKEFVLGLLDKGEVLLDDISVVESPGGAATQMIPNTNFESGLARWRIIGNHHGEVVDDPDQPGNKVLKLSATGSTDHMSNHAEITLAGGRSVVNGRTYRISYRAKWLYGSRQLNTRLYFNRLARTTVLEGRTRFGTPGETNSVVAANIGPAFDGLRHEPAVPAVFAPVTVSVRVSDPDGVAGVTLWSRLDRGAWSARAMIPDTGETTRYTAVLPGRGAGAVVQFYVEAVDGRGARAWFPSAGPESRAMYQVNDGLAKTNGLHNVRLVTLGADADRLHQTIHLMSNDRLGATLIYDERDVYYDIGLRLKGSEHSRTTSQRVGFNLGFPSAQRFRGVHRSVAIDRSESTGFGQREMLAHQMLNHCGGVPTKYHDLIQVMAPKREHTGTAELQLGRYTDVFLDGQYERGSEGMLFEYELVYQLNSTDNGSPEGNKVPAPDSFMGIGIGALGGLGARSNDKESYRWTFLIKNNEDRDDYSGAMAFCKWMAQTGTAFTSQISNRVDVDQWLRGHAVNVLTGAGDSYGGDGAQHNVQFYVRPTDGRVLYFPHDMDAFYDPNRAIVPNNDLARILAVPGYARRYYQQLLEIIETTYNVSYMGRWARHFGQLLPEQPFNSHLDFIRQRRASVLNQVNAAVLPSTRFAITTNGGEDHETDAGTVVLTGTANLTVREIVVNGVAYAPTWTSRTVWSVTVPLVRGVNRLTVQGSDRFGRPMETALDTITVTNTGASGMLPVVINEWMAANAGPDGYVDPTDGRFDDWIELYNPNDTPVDLSGYLLSDDPMAPGKWRVPNGIQLEPHGYLLIWADGDVEQNLPGRGLHASFQLSGQGEFIGLYNSMGVEQHSVEFGQQSAGVSEGLIPDGDRASVRFMRWWTPGGANVETDAVRVDSVRVQAGRFRLGWRSWVGRGYRVEYVDDLTDSNWRALGGDRVAVDERMDLEDSVGLNRGRYYRVRRVN